jgi:fucose permease
MPIFAHHLTDKFGLSTEQASLFFIINTVSYLLTIYYLNEITNLFGIKLTMTIGLLINGIAVLLIHPIGFFPQ